MFVGLTGREDLDELIRPNWSNKWKKEISDKERGYSDKNK